MPGTKIREANISKAIVKALNELPGTKVWKRRAGPFEKGRADVTGSCHGYRVEIEVKRPGEKPTALQQAWIEEHQELGCIAGWVTSIDEALALVVGFFDKRRKAA